MTESGEVFYGAATIAALLSIGKAIVILFAFGFIIYANRFVMRSRKREMGLYGILGLSKKHIAAILFVENVITSTVAIGLGIIVGTFLNKLMLLVLYKLVGQKPLDGLVFSTNALLFTLIAFEFWFFVCYIYNALSVNFGKPIALLKSENMGEKEPKTRYILLIDEVAGASALSDSPPFSARTPSRASTICSTEAVPSILSTSGISFNTSSRYLSARHPVTMRALYFPLFLYSPSSMMVLILSSFASPIKQHVLTTAASAISSSSVNSCPRCDSKPSMTSESTRFLSQPRDTNNIFILVT